MGFSAISGYPGRRPDPDRAEVVSEKGLAEIARELDLGQGLLLGRGEERSGDGKSRVCLPMPWRPLLGAIFLDGGFAAACQVVERRFAAAIKKSALAALRQ